jgi:hypothetical protein
MTTNELIAALPCAVEDAIVRELRACLRGDVLDRAHPRYDGARRVWNGLIDRYPAVIARCTDTADVVEAVRVARTHRPTAYTWPSGVPPAPPIGTRAWSPGRRPPRRSRSRMICIDGTVADPRGMPGPTSTSGESAVAISGRLSAVSAGSTPIVPDSTL